MVRERERKRASARWTEIGMLKAAMASNRTERGTQI